MIGMITPAGVVSEYPVPTASSGLQEITAGPDGNLWFTESAANQIGKITPAGVVNEYPVPTASSHPWGITAGPDGNLWFTESTANMIAMITPAGVVSEYASVVSGPTAIVTGPDGNLWFVNGGMVARFSVATHEVTFKSLAGAVDIASGPSGRLWCPAENYVAQVSTSLAIAKAHLKPSARCAGVARGPNGRVWFTENPGNAVGRLTPPVRKLTVAAAVSLVRQSGITRARFAGTAGPGLRGATLHLEWNEWYYVDLLSKWMWVGLAYAPGKARIGTHGRFSVSLRVDRRTRYRVGHCWVEGMAGTTGWHKFSVR
jgi:sugar lactone lactonase YvrE